MEPGSCEQLYRRLAGEFTFRFLGAANLIPVELVRIAETVATVRFGPAGLTDAALFALTDRGQVFLASASTVLLLVGVGSGSLTGFLGCRCNPNGLDSVRTGMRRTGKVLGTGALLLVVVGCGAHNAGSAPSSTPPAATTTPPASTTTPPASTTTPPAPSTNVPPRSHPTQGVPPGDTDPAANQVDVSALPADYPRDVILADGGATVVIQAEQAGCDRLSAAPGEQTASQVVVTVTLTRAPRGQMCPMHIKENPLFVHLNAPLGGRQLVLRPGS
ncbi:hypothetical protein ATK36_0003 [Amycolatopsis sulphurea]|uniref:Uncharacterized protein n=1 Tax=Amycolatopsis sulphurea TaxID=76022 RepID=A0A2A9G0Q0_9PSEU|nr:hypothetical protein [Amycolatopsis sulphurea]PFG56491.1 hypothetical protein ATK36_0003 [Amycolatopsis sulphurea]